MRKIYESASLLVLFLLFLNLALVFVYFLEGHCERDLLLEPPMQHPASFLTAFSIAFGNSSV
jgi:hypothetical protein